MQYTTKYHAPIGEILLACDDTGLTGLWFDKAKYYARTLDTENEAKETPILKETKRWLDTYFSGKAPDFLPPIHITGSDFQLAVWEILLKIPYGQTTTYARLAEEIADSRGLARMSAQAVGGAVGHNPISVIIPCHRVVGTNRSLTGYAGGTDKKSALLALEGVSVENGKVVTER